MKKALLIVLGLALVGIAVGCAGPDAAQNADGQDILKVGTDATFPPFESVDENTNEYVGFDIDLVRAIGEHMNREVEIVNVAFDGLIPGLVNGNYDFVAAAMTVTPDRAESVDFSDAYFQASQVILVRDDNNSIQGPDDLEGKYVTVQIGTTGDLYVSDSNVGRVGRFNSAPEALLEVSNKNADACVVDKGVAERYVAQNPGQVRIVGVPFTDESYAMAVRRGNKELLDKLNAAIRAIREDGTYDQIYSKWFQTAG